jgi:hypothetical protein
MTNPTDTGGENPTIRDVSPPSDTRVTPQTLTSSYHQSSRSGLTRILKAIAV